MKPAVFIRLAGACPDTDRLYLRALMSAGRPVRHSLNNYNQGIRPANHLHRNIDLRPDGLLNTFCYSIFPYVQRIKKAGHWSGLIIPFTLMLSDAYESTSQFPFLRASQLRLYHHNSSTVVDHLLPVKSH